MDKKIIFAVLIVLVLALLLFTYNIEKADGPGRIESSPSAANNVLSKLPTPREIYQAAESTPSNSTSNTTAENTPQTQTAQTPEQSITPTPLDTPAPKESPSPETGPEQTPTQEPSAEPEPTPSPTPEQSITVVERTDSGFFPQIATINVGDAIEFKNKTASAIRPASDPYPTVDGYPERYGCIMSTFDACTGIEPGRSWTFTFNIAGRWGYHDYMHPSYKGTVVVKSGETSLLYSTIHRIKAFILNFIFP